MKFPNIPMFVPTVRIDGRTYKLEEFDALSRIELLEMRRAIEGEMHEITAQMELEKLNPSRDSEWLLRVTRAKRAYTRALRHIEGTIEIRKQQAHESFMTAFVQAAQAHLPEAVFEELVITARSMQPAPEPAM